MADSASNEEARKKMLQEAFDKTTDPLEKLRLKCLLRGITGVREFGRFFCRIDKDRSYTIDVNELVMGVTKYGLTEEDAKTVFKQLDKDGSGTISYDVLLEAVRPSMNEMRKALVNEAFNKIDRKKDGIINLDDLHRVMIELGGTKEEFLSNFDDKNYPDGKVTREEFLNYYSGLSASIEDDAHFSLIIRNAYKL